MRPTCQEYYNKWLSTQESFWKDYGAEAEEYYCVNVCKKQHLDQDGECSNAR